MSSCDLNLSVGGRIGLRCLVCGGERFKKHRGELKCLTHAKDNIKNMCCSRVMECMDCHHMMTFLFPYEQHFNVYRRYCANINVGYGSIPLLMCDGRQIHVGGTKSDDKLDCPVCHLRGLETKIPFDIYVDLGYYMQFKDGDDPITDLYHPQPDSMKKMKQEYTQRQQSENAQRQPASDTKSPLNMKNIAAGVIASAIFEYLNNKTDTIAQLQSALVQTKDLGGQIGSGVLGAGGVLNFANDLQAAAEGVSQTASQVQTAGEAGVKATQVVGTGMVMISKAVMLISSVLSWIIANIHVFIYSFLAYVTVMIIHHIKLHYMKYYMRTRIRKQVKNEFLRNQETTTERSPVDIFRTAFTPLYGSIIHENLVCKNCGYVFVMRSVKESSVRIKQEIILDIISQAYTLRSSTSRIEQPVTNEIFPQELAYGHLMKMSLVELQFLRTMVYDKEQGRSHIAYLSSVLMRSAHPGVETFMRTNPLPIIRQTLSENRLKYVLSTSTDYYETMKNSLTYMNLLRDEEMKSSLQETVMEIIQIDLESFSRYLAGDIRQMWADFLRVSSHLHHLISHTKAPLDPFVPVKMLQDAWKVAKHTLMGAIEGEKKSHPVYSAIADLDQVLEKVYLRQSLLLMPYYFLDHFQRQQSFHHEVSTILDNASSNGYNFETARQFVQLLNRADQDTNIFPAHMEQVLGDRFDRTWLRSNVGLGTIENKPWYRRLIDKVPSIRSHVYDLTRMENVKEVLHQKGHGRWMEDMRTLCLQIMDMTFSCTLYQEPDSRGIKQLPRSTKLRLSPAKRGAAEKHLSTLYSIMVSLGGREQDEHRPFSFPHQPAIDQRVVVLKSALAAGGPMSGEKFRRVTQKWRKRILQPAAELIQTTASATSDVAMSTAKNVARAGQKAAVQSKKGVSTAARETKRGAKGLAEKLSDLKYEYDLSFWPGGRSKPEAPPTCIAHHNKPCITPVSKPFHSRYFRPYTKYKEKVDYLLQRHAAALLKTFQDARQEFEASSAEQTEEDQVIPFLKFWKGRPHKEVDRIEEEIDNAKTEMKHYYKKMFPSGRMILEKRMSTSRAKEQINGLYVELSTGIKYVTWELQSHLHAQIQALNRKTVRVTSSDNQVAMLEYFFRTADVQAGQFEVEHVGHREPLSPADFHLPIEQKVVKYIADRWKRYKWYPITDAKKCDKCAQSEWCAAFSMTSCCWCSRKWKQEAAHLDLQPGRKQVDRVSVEDNEISPEQAEALKSVAFDALSTPWFRKNDPSNLELNTKRPKSYDTETPRRCYIQEVDPVHKAFSFRHEKNTIIWAPLYALPDMFLEHYRGYQYTLPGGHRPDGYEEDRQLTGTVVSVSGAYFIVRKSEGFSKGDPSRNTNHYRIPILEVALRSQPAILHVAIPPSRLSSLLSIYDKSYTPPPLAIMMGDMPGLHQNHSQQNDNAQRDNAQNDNVYAHIQQQQVDVRGVIDVATNVLHIQHNNKVYAIPNIVRRQHSALHTDAADRKDAAAAPQEDEASLSTAAGENSELHLRAVVQYKLLENAILRLRTLLAKANLSSKETWVGHAQSLSDLSVNPLKVYLRTLPEIRAYLKSLNPKNENSVVREHLKLHAQKLDAYFHKMSTQRTHLDDRTSIKADMAENKIRDLLSHARSTLDHMLQYIQQNSLLQTTSQADDNTSSTAPLPYKRLAVYRKEIDTMLQDVSYAFQYQEDKWTQAVEKGDFDAIDTVIDKLNLDNAPGVRKVKTKLVKELRTIAKNAEAIGDNAEKIKDGLWNEHDLDDMKIAWMTQAWKPKTKTLLSRSGAQAKECSTPCPQCSESPWFMHTTHRPPSWRCWCTLQWELAIPPKKDVLHAPEAGGPPPKRSATLKEMLNKKGGLTGLKQLGIGVETLANAGATPPQLEEAGFSARELKEAGFSARKMQEGGSSAKKLKKAGFSAREMKEAGSSAKELKEAGFSARELHDALQDDNACCLLDLDSKQVFDQLKELGFSKTVLQKLQREVWQPTAEDKAESATLSKLRAELDKASADQKGSGKPKCSLFAPRYKHREHYKGNEKYLREVGFSPERLQAESGFTAKDLKEAYFSPKDIARVFQTSAALKGLDFTHTALKSNGFTAKKLRNEGGFSAMDLAKSGFSDEELKAAGFSATEMKAKGLTAAELRMLGYSAKDVAQVCTLVPFTTTELKKAGFSVKVLKKKANFSAVDLNDQFSADEKSSALRAKDKKALLQEYHRVNKLYRVSRNDVLLLKQSGITDFIGEVHESTWVPIQMEDSKPTPQEEEPFFTISERLKTMYQGRNAEVLSPHIRKMRGTVVDMVGVYPLVEIQSHHLEERKTLTYRAATVFDILQEGVAAPAVTLPSASLLLEVPLPESFPRMHTGQSCTIQDGKLTFTSQDGPNTITPDGRYDELPNGEYVVVEDTLQYRARHYEQLYRVVEITREDDKYVIKTEEGAVIPLDSQLRWKEKMLRLAWLDNRVFGPVAADDKHVTLELKKYDSTPGVVAKLVLDDRDQGVVETAARSKLDKPTTPYSDQVYGMIQLGQAYAFLMAEISDKASSFQSHLGYHLHLFQEHMSGHGGHLEKLVQFTKQTYSNTFVMHNAVKQLARGNQDAKGLWDVVQRYSQEHTKVRRQYCQLLGSMGNPDATSEQAAAPPDLSWMPQMEREMLQITLGPHWAHVANRRMSREGSIVYHYQEKYTKYAYNLATRQDTICAVLDRAHQDLRPGLMESTWYWNVSPTLFVAPFEHLRCDLFATPSETSGKHILHMGTVQKDDSSTPEVIDVYPVLEVPLYSMCPLGARTVMIHHDLTWEQLEKYMKDYNLEIIGIDKSGKLHQSFDSAINKKEGAYMYITSNDDEMPKGARDKKKMKQIMGSLDNPIASIDSSEKNELVIDKFPFLCFRESNQTLSAKECAERAVVAMRERMSDDQVREAEKVPFIAKTWKLYDQGLLRVEDASTPRGNSSMEGGGSEDKNQDTSLEAADVRRRMHLSTLCSVAEDVNYIQRRSLLFCTNLSNFFFQLCTLSEKGHCVSSRTQKLEDQSTRNFSADQYAKHVKKVTELTQYVPFNQSKLTGFLQVQLNTHEPRFSDNSIWMMSAAETSKHKYEIPRPYKLHHCDLCGCSSFKSSIRLQMLFGHGKLDDPMILGVYDQLKAWTKRSVRWLVTHLFKTGEVLLCYHCVNCGYEVQFRYGVVPFETIHDSDKTSQTSLVLHKDELVEELLAGMMDMDRSTQYLVDMSKTEGLKPLERFKSQVGLGRPINLTSHSSSMADKVRRMLGRGRNTRHERNKKTASRQ